MEARRKVIRDEKSYDKQFQRYIPGTGQEPETQWGLEMILGPRIPESERRIVKERLSESESSDTSSSEEEEKKN